MFFWAANYALGECIVVKMVTPTTIYSVWVWRLNGLDLRPCTARLKTWCRSVGNLGLRPKPISNKLELNADLLAFGCPKWNGLMCGRVRHGMALTSCLYVLTTGDRVSWFLVIAYPYDESKSCVWWIVLFVFLSIWFVVFERLEDKWIVPRWFSAVPKSTSSAFYRSAEKAARTERSGTSGDWSRICVFVYVYCGNKFKGNTHVIYLIYGRTWTSQIH